MAKRTLLERFLAKIAPAESEDACWLWTGNHNNQRYGMFWNGERKMLAHRWAYEHFIGPIPAGLVLDHLCRTSLCVRPSHLEPVTQAENMRRGKRARQRYCKRGHPLFGDNLMRKLSESKRTRRRCKLCEVNRQRRLRGVPEVALAEVRGRPGDGPASVGKVVSL